MDPGGSYTRHRSTSRTVEPTQIVSVNTNTKPPSAIGMMRSREYVTIDISQMVGAIQVTPSVGEQWFIIRDAGIWKLDRQIPFNTPAILESTVPGQVRLGSTGPVVLAGSEVQVNAPLRINNYTTESRPPASSVSQGSQIYDTTINKPLWSDGTEWQEVAGSEGTFSKEDIGLGSVDNTADAAKNVLSATKLTTPRTINGVNFDGTANITVTDSTKEPVISAGTTSQFWRGDKSWQTVPLSRQNTYHIDDYGADPTGVADSKAAVIAAYNALNGKPGIIEFGVGKYRIGTGTNDAAGLNEAAGRLLKPGQGIRGQGVGQTIIDYRGTGACFEFRDRNFDDTSSNVIHHHGGCIGLNILGWDNPNDNTCGIRYGDQSRMYVNDVEVAGFNRPGGKGLWGDNQYRWSERANITMTIARCTDNVLLEAATPGHTAAVGSFDYSQYWFAGSVGPNMNGFTLRRAPGMNAPTNKASMNGCKLTFVGNAVVQPPGTPNTGVLLTFGGSNDDTARYTGELYINVETSGTAGGTAHKDINQGTGPFDQIQSRVAATGSINLIPIADSNFQAGSADRRSFAFAGLLKNVSCFGSTGANNAFQSLNLVAQARGSQYLENTDAIQHVYVKATGGTFTLTFNGETTTPLAYNATPAQVQSALVALSTIGTSTTNGVTVPRVTVADTKARFINGVLQVEEGYELVFGGTLGSSVVPLVTANATNLTGSTTYATVVERRPGSPNDTYVLLLEGGSIFLVDPPAGTYRMRTEVTGLTSMGSPALGGDSPFGLNTVDIWIKQPDVGSPVIFQGPWFAPRKGAGSLYSFRWIEGQEPTLSTTPGAIDIIRLSSYNFGVWVGEHLTKTVYSGTDATKEPIINPGTTSQYWRGDKTWQTLDKNAVGLGNVSNVAQEPAITAGTTSQWLRGDKSWQKIGPETVGKSYVVPSTYASGYYYLFNSLSSSSTTNNLGNNNLRLSPAVISSTVTISRLWVEHTAAGEASAVFRIGVYADNGNGWPGNLVVDAGTVSMAGAAAVQEVTVNVTLNPGVYWVGGVVQGAATTQPTVRVINGNNMEEHNIPFGTSLPSAGAARVSVVRGGTSGALPATFDALSTNTISGSFPARVGFKVA